MNISQGNNYWSLNFGPFADVSYTSPVIKILSPSETLASLRHIYVDSCFLDPEGIRKLNTGAIWKEQGSFNLV
jgi:hypothetical protein